jgi:uncharacterized protein (TIRG00374 family)
VSSDETNIQHKEEGTAGSPTMKPEISGRRRRFTPWLRLVVGLLLLGFLLLRFDVQEMLAALRQPSWTGILVACAAVIVAKIVLAARWRDLLESIGIRRRLRDLVALVYVGLFFGLFLPSAIGGDVARGYYVTGPKDTLAESFSVLVVERILGLLGLVAVAAAAAAVELSRDTSPLPSGMLVGFLGFGSAIVVGGAAFLAWRGLGNLLRPLSRFGERADRVVTALVRGLGVLRLPETPRLRLVFLSLLLPLLGVAFYLGCARAVGVQTAALAFFLIVPVAVIISMIPVTLNGLGLREGAMTGLMLLYGAQPDRVGAFVLLSLAVATLFSLFGGVLHLFYRPPWERQEGVATPAT